MVYKHLSMWSVEYFIGVYVLTWWWVCRVVVVGVRGERFLGVMCVLCLRFCMGCGP